eukprot:SAG31_NODE_13180_length_887_cov_1.607868_1_plen_78_part_00
MYFSHHTDRSLTEATARQSADTNVQMYCNCTADVKQMYSKCTSATAETAEAAEKANYSHCTDPTRAPGSALHSADKM